MGGAHHGLCPHAAAVHGLALGGFQNRELHLVDLVEQQPAWGGPRRTAVCEAVRAWIVLPQAKVGLVEAGFAGQPRPGDLPGGPEAVQVFDHPEGLLPRATQDDDVGFKQDGVGGREQREQERLPPEAT